MGLTCPSGCLRVPEGVSAEAVVFPELQPGASSAKHASFIAVVVEALRKLRASSLTTPSLSRRPSACKSTPSPSTPMPLSVLPLRGSSFSLVPVIVTALFTAADLGWWISISILLLISPWLVCVLCILLGILVHPEGCFLAPENTTSVWVVVFFAGLVVAVVCIMGIKSVELSVFVMIDSMLIVGAETVVRRKRGFLGSILCTSS